MSKVMRSVKNVTKGYSSAQVKVREATSNDPWGPTGTQMSEIAQMTYNTSTEFYEIMDMIDKRLNDKGKNWRHVLKALKVLDYCLHEGSELVVTWARQSIYIIKTLREFQYVDEEGRDVGQNGNPNYEPSEAIGDPGSRALPGSRSSPPQHAEPAAAAHGNRRQRERRVANDEEDTEYRLAIEASKYQEEEDRKKRESRQHGVEDDDDLQKAIKLSQEEEERRRKELEESNAHSLFDDDPVPQQQTSQPQYTGFNQGYQQGNPVDFFANPIDQNQPQPTGYMANAYTGFPQQGQPTGFQTNLNTGFGQPMNMDPYGQQQNQQQQLAFQQPQPTGFNPYLQQQQLQQQQLPQQSLSSPASPEPTLQPGSNNPWATHNNQAQAMQPTPTGSNNPFAQFGRPQSARPNPISSLGSLPEQKTLNTFSSQPQLQQQNSFPQAQPAFNPPQKEMNEHETRLNSLLATGDGMDTFGNTGNLRIPAQHTAPGTFVNSAGAGVARINAEATGNNPFLRQQFTGMPTVNYGAQMPAATGPAGMNGQTNNPFAAHPAPQQQQNQDLIQF
ncbi:hypothetical protein CEP54_005648 [Fusarium duplospermum]|uniref:ENTH domain-containing protein n=1 Tax=Fusarium duplospermum TaxID=1325734 RepID=A0A428QB49_9HYPO|nr:hypothetical protein CEP54_005648 [Fusarium duplospermum]